MSDQFIVEHCSPTLAGLKTGNLFSIRFKAYKDVCGEVRELNRLLGKKGLRALPVRRTQTATLVYLYRPDYLRRDLRHPGALQILSEKGYSCDSAESCIAQLLRHLSTDESFPHEIGLFLGYPPEDVRGFMENTRKGVKCVGCWKVYGHQEEAERTFSRYRKCTEVYRRVLAGGRPLSKMIVRTDGRHTGRDLAKQKI